MLRKEYHSEVIYPSAISWHLSDPSIFHTASILGLHRTTYRVLHRTEYLLHRTTYYSQKITGFSQPDSFNSYHLLNCNNHAFHMLHSHQDCIVLLLVAATYQLHTAFMPDEVKNQIFPYPIRKLAWINNGNIHSSYYLQRCVLPLQRHYCIILSTIFSPAHAQTHTYQRKLVQEGGGSTIIPFFQGKHWYSLFRMSHRVNRQVSGT